MGLFQQSVLNKYLNEASQTEMKAAYQKLTTYFHNPVIQQNIRDCKEEQWQGGFLTELFVKVFGYTMNPNPDYNLTTEHRNERGAKKADGALLKDGAAVGVIELKSTTTKDLEAIRLQAFDYKANQSKCVYVITSNFEKVRFYIHNTVEFEEFDLFRLTYEHFQLMWLCLAKENLLREIPLQVKEASILKEENVTKKIYVDYSRFKYDLYNDLVANNLNHEIFKDKEEKDIRLLLFKKSQKLLDRFLFILFGEDHGLLPANSISKIIEKWNDDTEWGDSKSLYDIFKQYFTFLNTGRPAKGKRAEIHAYNGGLFLPDAILDSVEVSSEMLNKHTKILTGYDFETEVDVNILGHIFENSLNEIEEVTAELEGEKIDLKKSKRKKDGVFYTPKYITKYIVENTVGKLCEEKRTELELDENEYLKSRKGRTKKKLQELDEKLTAYRDWLLSLTICDPACGSGAFLNQALDFLIREHRYIDELRAKMLDVPMVFTEVENSILENNIYGVDINEESVEIAKLSLWLRTAQKGRKLTTLSNNIKCGNSLIDDPEVAGEKAFNWQTEFPNIFPKKKKKAWHVTTATHNSRYSQRMFDNHVKKGKPVWLSEKEEVIVTETISEIVEKDRLNIIAYNICGDHAHLIITCTEEELPRTIQKIKAMSARACNIAMGRTIPGTRKGEHAPLGESDTETGTPEPAPAHLTSTTEKKGEHAPRGKTQFHLWAEKFDGREITSNEQLENTIAYINNNRKKHQLPEIKALQQIIAGMTCSRKHAFRAKYAGGFDVVIGNPPYVRAERLTQFIDNFRNNFKVFDPASDLFAYFYEKGLDIINNSGLMGYISNTFDKTTAGKVLRNFLSEYASIKKYVDFTQVQIFEGATTYPVIIILNKEWFKNSQFLYKKVPKIQQSKIIDIDNLNSIQVLQHSLNPDSWSFLEKNKALLFEKLNRLPSIREKYGKCFYGVKTALNEAFIVRKEWPVSKHIKYIYEGKEIKKWNTPPPEQKLILFESKWTKSYYDIEVTEKIALEKMLTEYPKTMEHLIPFEEKAKKRYDKGEFWWELRNCAYYDLFDKPKIIFPNLQNTNKFCLDENGVFINAPAVFLPVASKTLLCVLNSKIVWDFLKSICVVRSGGYIEVKPQYFEQIPIPEITNEDIFEQTADKIIGKVSELQNLQFNFIKLIQSKFEIERITQKLQDWPKLEFSGFLNELKKAKVKLTLSEEAEWMAYFNEQKQKALALKSEIDKTDREIDGIVYELYGLTEEEIKIVEGK